MLSKPKLLADENIPRSGVQVIRSVEYTVFLSPLLDFSTSLILMLYPWITINAISSAPSG